MGFARELRAALAHVVGRTPPPAEGGDALLFYRQWLNESNLGLVPVADAAGFSWPGRWIARVVLDGAAHAVVMFGSPAGPLEDPAGAIAAGGTVVEGWIVAPLDLALPLERPYGEPRGTGTVAALLLAPEAEAPLEPVEEALAVAGRGLAGDRYAAGRGTFSGAGRGYELTLVEAEHLDSLGVAWPAARRNVVVRGTPLNALVGRRFRVGEAECVGRRLAEPCAHLERVSGAALLRPLVHRAGLRADILVGGRVRVGDPVVPLP